MRYRTKKIAGRSHLEHRWVWEQAHGPIPDGHVVHHINHDKLDNRIENLELLTHQEHSKHHNQRHALTKTCEACGAIFTPHPTKRARAKSCSWECRSVLMARTRIARMGEYRCGTERAYRAHLGRGEDCTTCRAAHAERAAKRKLTSA